MSLPLPPDADTLGVAEHAAAIRALAQAGAGDLQATLRDLRTVLLSADPRALRRSVGFWGRLIGRDIRLAAEARSLRERSGILLRQAGFEASRLRNQHATLVTHAQQLREACAKLQHEIDGLAHQHATLGQLLLVGGALGTGKRDRPDQGGLGDEFATGERGHGLRG